VVNSRNPYIPPALLFSCAAHAALAYVLLFGVIYQGSEPEALVVYSVTMEGGLTRGGISQIPETGKETQMAPPKKVSAAEPKTESLAEIKDKQNEAEAEPAEDAEVSLAETPAAAPSPEPSSAPSPGPSPAPRPKPSAAPAKPRVPAKPAQRPVSAAEINRQYQAAMQRYLGESTNAGGKGFGADGRGGRGMGGGIVRPPEWFIYKDELEGSIKKGWNWYDPRAELRATVTFRISPGGEISEVDLKRSSGNGPYDESVLRAVNKASPVRPPPPEFYGDFRFVEMDFEPQ